MTAPYREFEKLVARIEGTLVPSGAVVKSPDSLLDLFTGEMREVDVSIRSKVGSVEILITVECRDRVKVEDVTWIEQIATKQKHIGAAHTIAVSSTGFSAPALAAARLHGISTRAIEDVTDAEIRAWAEKVEVDEVSTECEIAGMHLTYFEDPGKKVELDQTSSQSWSERGWDAPIFLEVNTGKSVTLYDLIAKAHLARLRPTTGRLQVTLPPQGRAVISADPLAALVADIPPDGTKVRKTVVVEFGQNEIAAHTSVGALSIRRLALEVAAASTKKRIPATHVLEYSDGRTPLGHVAEKKAQIGRAGHDVVITQYRAATRAGEKK